MRRIRRQRSQQKLTPETRAFIEERSKGLEGWTKEQLDEHARISLEGHEDELRQALQESDDMRAWIREHRRPTRGERLSKATRLYIERHGRALEGWTEADVLALEHRSAAGHDGEIEQAFREGVEMRAWIRAHRA